MASCMDDCLYYKVCSDFIGNICETDLNRFMEYRMTPDGLCEHFKNKADVAEVKHGKWIKRIVENNGIARPSYICSNCKKRRFVLADYKYCPNCSAKMDGKEDA